MNWTKKQRKDLVKAFKAAKRNLWDGSGKGNTTDKRRTIVWALARAYTSGSLTYERWCLAEGLILSRLNGPRCLDQWLYDRGFLSSPDFPHSPEEERRLQQYRHAWLDHLIEEFLPASRWGVT